MSKYLKILEIGRNVDIRPEKDIIVAQIPGIESGKTFNTVEEALDWAEKYLRE